MKITKRILSLLMVIITLAIGCVAGTTTAAAANDIPVSNGFFLSGSANTPLNSVNGTAYGYLGDTDNDRKISVRDATNIQKFVARIVNFSDISLFLSDVNFDGTSNIKDATAIQKYLAKINIKENINHVIYAPKNNFSINNVYYNPNNMVYTDGKVTLSLYKLYWLGGTLYVEGYVLNGTDKPVYNTPLNYLSISNAQGNIVNGDFNNVVLKEIPAHSYGIVKLTFMGDAITNYGADLSSHIYTYALY